MTRITRVNDDIVLVRYTEDDLRKINEIGKEIFGAFTSSEKPHLVVAGFGRAFASFVVSKVNVACNGALKPEEIDTMVELLDNEAVQFLVTLIDKFPAMFSQTIANQVFPTTETDDNDDDDDDDDDDKDEVVDDTIDDAALERRKKLH